MATATEQTQESEPHQRERRRNAACKPGRRGLYDPAYEHDACGVGFVARLDGDPDHQVVGDAVEVLVNLEHRGAVGGDRATGDGAGLLLRIPDAFLRQATRQGGLELPAPGDYAAGMIFLPSASGPAHRCEQVLETALSEEGCRILGWRTVPTCGEDLGELARQSEPVVRQVFVARGSIEPEEFERRLYLARRSAEKQIGRRDDVEAGQFYVASLSSRTILYKGMLKGSQLVDFYPELAHPSFASPFVVLHQRYSTNTFPTWSLAQPFRMLAHNGEINTLRGNVNHMRAREPGLRSELFGEGIEKLKPIVQEGGSDSAMVDNALEFLVRGGRSLPHAVMMLVPAAWGPRYNMSDDLRAFYEYHSAIMEPWDGPAALVFTDGRYVGGTLDRNGLRPCRYTVTTDGYVVLASETGALGIEPERVKRHGRLQPGKMLLVDMAQNRIVSDTEIKSRVSRRRPYRRWVEENRVELPGMFEPGRGPQPAGEDLLRQQHAFGYTNEDRKLILGPMASRGKEPTGSMGNDAALAVLSDRPQLLFAYFKQLFAQVTNPPIDPLREELVMSLMNFVGRRPNLLEETPEHFRRLKLKQPLLSPEDLRRIRDAGRSDVVAREIDILFAAGGDGRALEKGLSEVFAQAERAIEEGATVLILTDRNLDGGHAPIPSLLASAGLHHHLTREGLRTEADIIVETGEAREVMHFALLLGYGAAAVCPRVALATVGQLAEEGLLEEPKTPLEAVQSYMKAVKQGLLKTFSRMGISTIRSYFGAQIFEAVGLSGELVNRFFTGTASRVEGIGLEEIAREALARHRAGFPDHGQVDPLLDMGGAYQVRAGGEEHLWTPNALYKLQQATRTDDYDVFREYTSLIDDQSEARVTLRSLFRFRDAEPVPPGEVEPVESIVRRFCTAAMSFGSISKEAHETIAIAMNRLGGQSNSGEGGEDPRRYRPLPGGDSMSSAIKQVASGRFGVTTEYLVNARELQIKMAQGAKPGEGGQLPGHKVSEQIARVRHTTPGVTLISPPPHHDIYSIEDLAQLIYDLKQVNPRARVSVKLVAEVGVGTIAAGVSKGKADMVLISGHDGGTGASPLTSIKHAGLPWELGLAETQQTLVLNRLRDRIRVQVDGQLKTGRDLAVAALLGAEEFGFGTTVLVCLGCVMMRKCHSNTCPVGIATQDPRLRRRFTGKPEYVERFFRFLARELRGYMARLGFRSVDEMVGRADMLDVEPAVEHWKARGLDLGAILQPAPAEEGHPLRCVRRQQHGSEPPEKQELLRRAHPAVERGEPVRISLPVRNTHRAVAATLSGQIARRHGGDGLPEGTIKLSLQGTAGQSLAAFLAPGIQIEVEGAVNDYLCKGMSGGRVVVRPPAGAGFDPGKNIIAGNTVLYGATGGEAYVGGLAGERFAVRNSGATAVVEGVGDHGCEYMTGGRVVVLGPTGYNFAAGMSGGIAYVCDEDGLFGARCNLGMVDLETVDDPQEAVFLRELIQNHLRHTGSPRARELLDDWENRLPLFVKVMPLEYRQALSRLKEKEPGLPARPTGARQEVLHG